VAFIESRVNETWRIKNEKDNNFQDWEHISYLKRLLKGPGKA